MDAIDKVEKELNEEQEIDTFILNNICGEIMDEVLDASNDLKDFTVALSKPKRKSSKGKNPGL